MKKLLVTIFLISLIFLTNYSYAVKPEKNNAQYTGEAIIDYDVMFDAGGFYKILNKCENNLGKEYRNKIGHLSWQDFVNYNRGLAEYSSSIWKVDRCNKGEINEIIEWYDQIIARIENKLNLNNDTKKNQIAVTNNNTSQDDKNTYDIISCDYKNIDIAEHIRQDLMSNATSEEKATYRLLFEVFLPFDAKIDFIHKSKNRWQIKSIKTNLENNFKKFLETSVKNGSMSKKEADKELKLNGNFDDQILEMFEYALRVLPDEKINIDPEDGRPLGEHIILSYTTDAAYYFRTKFNYNDINKGTKFKTEAKTIGFDGTVHISNTGNCINKSFNNISIESTNNDNDNLSKLKKLKLMFEEELITQDEYDAKRKEILDEM